MKQTVDQCQNNCSFREFREDWALWKILGEQPNYRECVMTNQSCEQFIIQMGYPHGFQRLYEAIVFSCCNQKHQTGKQHFLNSDFFLSFSGIYSQQTWWLLLSVLWVPASYFTTPHCPHLFFFTNSPFVCFSLPSVSWLNIRIYFTNHADATPCSFTAAVNPGCSTESLIMPLNE